MNEGEKRKEVTFDFSDHRLLNKRGIQIIDYENTKAKNKFVNTSSL